MKEKKCKRCGELFQAKGKQVYCGKEKVAICVECGESFTYICGPTVNQTCSAECAIAYSKKQRAASLSTSTRICKWCGKEFTPKTAQELYCHEQHYQTCVICGKQFEIDVRRDSSVQTCSPECKKQLQSKNHDYVKGAVTQRAHLLEKYGVDNSAKISGSTEKAKATNLAKYGVDSYTKTAEYRARVKETCNQRYGVDHHLKAESVIQKRESTCLARYGSPNIFSSSFGKQQIATKLTSKYGVRNPSQYPAFRKKAVANARQSNLEMRVAALLTEFNISFERHHIVRDIEANLIHEFDFYLPVYRILIDCDGLYYHSYLDDPDGGHVLDYYDETRIALVPKDHIFHVIVEGQEDADIKQLSDTLKQIDADVFDYEGSLFHWCRSIEFPYPSYSEDRIRKDYNSLCRRNDAVYTPSARVGDSAIQQFHRSIYDAHVGEYPSPKEAWYDDKLLKRVIANRLIYKNNVDPFKIMRGFNISKICPRVSVFNPVLGKYLVDTYLSNFDTVFDPFSGFSGRLLGCCAAGKHYIGQDINTKAVHEANQLIEFLGLADASVIQQNILEDFGSYSCLLTCPPYGTKERYSTETEFKSCDEWITEILQRYQCSRYVFVVDHTELYAPYIREEIKSTSHFNKLCEYVVVIDK